MQREALDSTFEFDAKTMSVFALANAFIVFLCEFSFHILEYSLTPQSLIYFIVLGTPLLIYFNVLGTPLLTPAVFYFQDVVNEANIVERGITLAQIESEHNSVLMVEPAMMDE